jgi:hypothetical protein
MRGSRNLWIAVWIGALLVGATVSATALGTLGGSVQSGSSQFATVVRSDASGVVAGLAAETTEGPLGLRESTQTLESGWVLAHPKGQAPTGTLDVAGERTFTDPNGGTWTVLELENDGSTAWAVQVDGTRYDSDLDGEYNFAIVVEWDQVPEGEDLTTSYQGTLDLAR